MEPHVVDCTCFTVLDETGADLAVLVAVGVGVGAGKVGDQRRADRSTPSHRSMENRSHESPARRIEALDGLDALLDLDDPVALQILWSRLVAIVDEDPVKARRIKEQAGFKVQVQQAQFYVGFNAIHETHEQTWDIFLMSSRDGFHWDRPERSTFIGVSDTPGAWNWANVQSAGGCCLIVGDQLYFYVSGRQGYPGNAEPGVCTTGLAILRRDGFASMDWLPGEGILRGPVSGARAGTLTTRPLRFSGTHLFVNADVPGELRVEVLDRTGTVIAPFTVAACIPVSGDGTRVEVRWNGADLEATAGREVRFRFSLTRGRLYAFWVSPWPTGESRGYPAAGGPGFTGPVDTAT